jgi:hypothetical protein
MSGEEKPAVLRELARNANSTFATRNPLWDRRIKVAGYVLSAGAGLLTFLSMGDVDLHGREHCFTGLWFKLRKARDSFFLGALPESVTSTHSAVTEARLRDTPERQQYPEALHWNLKLEAAKKMEELAETLVPSGSADGLRTKNKQEEK